MPPFSTSAVNPLYDFPSNTLPAGGRVEGAISQCFCDQDIRYNVGSLGHGWLYKLQGQKFYSPNCNRPSVRLPPPIDNPNDGVIKGSAYSSEEFQQPHWWTRAHGYLAFVPLYPDISVSPLHPLTSVPRTRYSEEHGHVPEEKTWQLWRDLQNKIAHAVHLLLFESGAPAVRPVLPCARIDSRAYIGKHTELQDDIHKARLWFSIWFGCLSYAIAVSEAMGRDGRKGSNGRPHPPWFNTILKCYHSQIGPIDKGCTSGGDSTCADLDYRFVSDLPSSCIGCFDGSIERAGVFVTIPDDSQPDQVSIDWLCALNIPVWYAWGDREEEIARNNPFWRRYAPSPGAVWVDTVPSHRTIVQMRRSEPKASERTWVEWFEKREQIHLSLISHETTEDKYLREMRKHKPPLSGSHTKFYVWDRNQNGIYVRRPARNEDLEDLFLANGKFGRQQARYDTVLNEWDLCEYFGPPDDAQINRIAERYAQFGGRSIKEEILRLRIFYGLLDEPESSSNLLASAQLAPSRSTNVETSSPLSSDLIAATDGVIVQLEREAPKKIDIPQSYKLNSIPPLVLGYELYGFTGSLTSQTKPPLSSVKAASFVPRALGISTIITREDVFWNTCDGQDLIAFLIGLAKGSPPRQFWDLSKDNRMPVASLPRFSLLRTTNLETIIQLSTWHNLSGRNIYVQPSAVKAFWFKDGVGDLGWLLGCDSAAIALVICRMDQQMDPYSLVFSLVGQGIQFRTWTRSTKPLQIDVRSSKALIKYRPEQHIFTSDDYETYLRNIRGLFEGPSGRLALLRGGLVWRLALANGVSISEVINIPPSTAIIGNLAVRCDGLGGYLVDYDLNEDELEAICGHYIICHDQQLGRVSWWPPADLWEQSYGSLGWTVDAENEYQLRLKEIKATYCPLTRAEWRTRMKQSSTINKLSTFVERESLRVIEDGGSRGGL